jgi:putative hemolysin
VAGAEFDRLYGGKWIWAFSLTFTFLMLQFTEILPKSAGVRYNRQAALWIARPLALLVRVARPVDALVQLVNRGFGGGRPRAAFPATVDEITALSAFARLSRQISTDQERIIRKGARLSQSKVRDVMRPRIDIDALDVNTPADEIVGAVAMSGFSRLPVYEGDLDNILGFVYIKDLLMGLHMGRPIELRKLLRPPVLVPWTLTLDQLLERFRQQRTQMAVVLDEYGGTKGLVTMEDVLEELVGAIHDEHRREEDTHIVRADATSWLVNGTFPLEDLFQAIGRQELHPVAPAEISTVGGLVQARLDRIPTAGDRTTWHDLSLEVLTMDGRRIQLIRITLMPEPPAASPP